METKKYEPLPIDGKMIDDYIHFLKNEYNQDADYFEAKAELENLQKNGCLLYDDCRSCPLFGKSCPI